MRWLILLFFLICFSSIFSQSADLQEVLKTLSQRYDEAANYEDMAALLTDLYSNPISINGNSREDLEQLFFLTDEQIENILYSHYMQGDFTSPYQLQRVDGLDSTTIRCMVPFISFAPSITTVKYHVRGSSIARLSSVMETPRGYKSINNEPPRYVGNKLNNMIRLRLQDNRVSEIGMIAEKDAGESYLDSKSHLPDHLSGFYQLKNGGVLRHLVIGDYNVSFGQGLVMGQGMMVGKSNEVLKIKSSYSGIRRHFSTVESGYCRGAALLLGKRKFRFTTFGSFKEIDASSLIDTLFLNNEIQTLYTTGLHRTTSEIASKSAISELFYGASAQYRFLNGLVELGGVGYRFGETFANKDDLYLAHLQRDQSGANSFLAFSGITNRLRYFGEIAVSEKSALALTGGAVFRASNRVQIALQARHIAKDYFAPRLRTFSESSGGSGESGIYLGCKLGLASKGILSGYVDLFRFDWPRYQINALTYGNDWLVQYQLPLLSKLDFEILIKGGENMVMESSEMVGARGVIPQSYLNGRLLVTSQVTESVEWASRVDFSRGKLDEVVVGTGVVVAQDFKVKQINKHFTLFFRVLLFDVDDEGSRIYVYEPDLLYSYNSQSYEGKGVRLVLGGGYKVASWITISAKIGRTTYSDRESIGAGADEIRSNHKSDGKFQISVSF